MFIELLQGILESLSINEGVKELQAQYVDSGKMPKDVFDKFVQADPSSTKKYVRWAAKEYVRDNGYIDADRYINVIRKFDELAKRNLIAQKDITAFNNLTHLEDEIERVGDSKSKREQKRDAKTKGAELVFENDKCYVYRIDTFEASQKYGANTKWCISGHTDTHWNTYTEQKNIKFYFIIHKLHGYKFAVQVDPDGRISVWDERDVIWRESDSRALIEDLGIDKTIFHPATIPWEEWLAKTKKGIAEHLEALIRYDVEFPAATDNLTLGDIADGIIEWLQVNEYIPAYSKQYKDGWRKPRASISQNFIYQILKQIY